MEVFPEVGVQDDKGLGGKSLWNSFGIIVYLYPRKECGMHDSYIQIFKGQSCRIESRSVPEDKTLNNGLRLQGNDSGHQK